MQTSISQMTKDELREVIESAVEKKLYEIFIDPDEGLEIKDKLKKRLIKQKKEVDKGDIGQSFDNIIKQLNIE